MGDHGIAWDGMASQRFCPLECAKRRIITRLHQTLNREPPESAQENSLSRKYSYFVLLMEIAVYVSRQRGPRAPVGSCIGQAAGKCQTVCKPGSVRPLRDGTAIPLGRISRCASRDQPGRRDRNVPAIITGFKAVTSQPPLFGLAPGGVYRAAPVARGAVRSYRTVSPLPAGPGVLARTGLARAVCFLWHCP